MHVDGDEKITPEKIAPFKVEVALLSELEFKHQVTTARVRVRVRVRGEGGRRGRGA